MNYQIKQRATLENIKVGDIVIDIHGDEHKITQGMYNQLWGYKQQTGKSPIRGGKILGTFLYQKWRIDVKEKSKKDVEDFILNLKALAVKIGFKISVRGWCYILEGEGFIDKSQFDQMERKINKYRKDGRLPIDFTAEDETRQFYNVEPLKIEYINPKEFIYNQIKDVKNLYQNKMDVSFWKFQDCYIQMLVEKGDLVNLFGGICEYYHIPIANAKGWSDLNLRNLMAQRYKEAEKMELKLVVLYYADHDPAGINIVKTFRKNLEQIEKATGWNPENLEINRFGLDKDFIVDKGLVWIENLRTGSKKDLSDPEHSDHYKPYVQDYIKEHGVRKCEANAVLKIRKIARNNCIEVIQGYLGKGEAPFIEYNEELESNRKEVKGIMDAVNFEDRILEIINDINKL